MIHYIPRSEIELNGLPDVEVASKLNQLLGNDVVYCDCLNLDRFCLNVLFSDCAIKPNFELQDIQAILLNDDRKLERYLECKEMTEATGSFKQHRALDDAKVIFQSLRGVL